MKALKYFTSGKRVLQSIRNFSDDPAKTFQQKGLSEENRYFLKKQQEELRKLRKELQLLAKFQTKLGIKIEQSQKAIMNLIGKEDEKKK